MFDITVQQPISHFLNIRLDHNAQHHTISLSQSHTIGHILARAGMLNVKPLNMPMEMGVLAKPSQPLSEADADTYRGITGAILYL
jgi:hypothetical protein